MKLIFAPALGVFCGGLFLAMMMPIAGPFGALVVGTLACMVAVGSGYTMCSLVDRSARAMFLRQTALGLPEARLLPPGRHHI